MGWSERKSERSTRICRICTSWAFTTSRASLSGPTPHPGAGDPSNVRATKHRVSPLPLGGSEKKEREALDMSYFLGIHNVRTSKSGPTPPPGAGDPSNVRAIYHNIVQSLPMGRSKRIGEKYTLCSIYTSYFNGWQFYVETMGFTNMKHFMDISWRMLFFCLRLLQIKNY
jgi:hypothetical protein